MNDELLLNLTDHMFYIQNRHLLWVRLSWHEEPVLKIPNLGFSNCRYRSVVNKWNQTIHITLHSKCKAIPVTGHGDL
jgi:hypothetical protein